uniref:hypothetical protein n=1 Tax=Rhodaphanes brevistipitata TaxID=446136 RepID=UPI001FCD5866|nr:hypothetical protein MW432_pgp144 [Rhodaphanes brevistipitata]UNJ18437.1 hypothetical protein [Rhodaphanes brevistipitata]
MIMHNNLKQAILERKVLKIISGINNFDLKNIINIINAAHISKATYIDIAANEILIKEIKNLTNLPICVSTIDPSIIYKCIAAGADLIEIGNYDQFYKNNILFTTNRILLITAEIRSLFPEITLCVTIPHYFSIQEQIYLAKQLAKLKVNVLQTEGISSQLGLDRNCTSNLSKNVLNASATLSMTLAIAEVTSIPIITASGINQSNANIALQYGACGVGVGSCINKLNNLSQMISMIKIIKSNLDTHSNHAITYGNNFLSSVPKSSSKKPIVKHCEV